MAEFVATEIAVTTFYKFVTLEPAELTGIAAKVRGFGELLGLRGLVLFAGEGCNATVAGSFDGIRAFKTMMSALPGFADLVFKDSRSARWPFRRFSVQTRDEIVTAKAPPRVPEMNPANRLSPKQWETALEDPDAVVLDVRNDYEVQLGRFKGARNPRLQRFSDFAKYVRHSGIPADRKILMYCTGGIRCEKAIEEMQLQGYTNVFQLDGGILKYLEECPERSFEGECFVFDHRVALDQRLNPSTRYGLCPYCGNPADQWITCSNCGKQTRVCASCRGGKKAQVCSKNCAYHAVKNGV